jgi:hypothetical protein
MLLNLLADLRSRIRSVRDSRPRREVAQGRRDPDQRATLGAARDAERGMDERLAV